MYKITNRSDLKPCTVKDTRLRDTGDVIKSIDETLCRCIINGVKVVELVHLFNPFNIPLVTTIDRVLKDAGYQTFFKIEEDFEFEEYCPTFLVYL